VQRLPRAETHYRWALPLFPRAIESFDLSGYDLVLSSSHCVAKGAVPAPGALSVCYCYTPMRYVWDRFDDYFGDKPAPLSPKEADSILQRIQEGVEKPKPKVLYEPGEVVRVNDGPFTDFNGVVEEVNYEKSRVRVAVLIFGRSTPVELEFGQVEKA
jgi:hypothetical protein